MVHYFLKKVASTQYNYSLSRSAIWHRVNTLRKEKRASPWLLAKNVINELHWPKYVAGLFFARMSKGLFIKVWEIQFHSDPLLASQRDSQEHSGHHHFFALLDHHCTLFNFLSNEMLAATPIGQTGLKMGWFPLGNGVCFIMKKAPSDSPIWHLKKRELLLPLSFLITKPLKLDLSNFHYGPHYKPRYRTQGCVIRENNITTPLQTPLRTPLRIL